MKNYLSKDNTLHISEYKKGYVSIKSGRLEHATQSSRITLDCFETGCYLYVEEGVSLDLSFDEFESIRDLEFGFTVEILSA